MSSRCAEKHVRATKAGSKAVQTSRACAVASYAPSPHSSASPRLADACASILWPRRKWHKTPHTAAAIPQLMFRVQIHIRELEMKAPLPCLRRNQRRPVLEIAVAPMFRDEALDCTGWLHVATRSAHTPRGQLVWWCCADDMRTSTKLARGIKSAA